MNIVYPPGSIIRSGHNLTGSVVNLPPGILSNVPVLAGPTNQYEEFDLDEPLKRNSLISEGTVAKHLLLILIYFSTATILLITISCIHSGCNDLVSWTRLLALYFIALTLIKIIQSSWALAQGELIQQSVMERVETINRWIGILEFAIFCFLTIAISFSIAYATETKDCETLFKITFFMTIMNWLAIFFLVVAFGLQYHKAALKKSQQ